MVKWNEVKLSEASKSCKKISLKLRYASLPSFRLSVLWELKLSIYSNLLSSLGIRQGSTYVEIL